VIDPVVPKRYAEALFLAARDANVVADVEADLTLLANALAEPRLRDAIGDPTLDAAAKRAHLLDPIAPKLRTALARNAIALVIDRRRDAVLLRLPQAFHRLALEARGEAEGVVETAMPLAPDALAAVADAIGRSLGKRVRLEQRVNATLVGGLRATVGSRRYDASVLARLSELRSRLLSAPLPA
jgi:F-type H+-transporting ATPase subunit delta